jgi:hypothetical protein
VDMSGTYSNRTDILQDSTELQRRIELSGPRRSKPSPPKASGRIKKQLTSEEAAEIVAKYEAGASMVQLRAEHHMAKRTGSETATGERGGNQAAGWTTEAVEMSRLVPKVGRAPSASIQ